MDTVNPKRIEIAISRVGGTDFENFAQGFFAATLGIDYVPMGGFHDGGADGVFDDIIYEASGTQKFMQASITAEPRTKIRATIKRLREFGRNPTTLLYATSRKIPTIDRIQEELSDDLACRIVIRDANFFQYQINTSPGAVQAYKAYVASAASYLNEIGTADTIKPNQGLPAKTLCVFLGQELDRRRGKSELLEAVTDSLILWALEGTDPDKGLFLTIAEIEQKVIAALPAAKTFFRGVIAQRIDLLCKRGVDGRKVNFHPKESGYCLPFETRKKIVEENIDDEALKYEVSDVFRSRAADVISDSLENDSVIEKCVDICHEVIHRSYRAQGLEIALFVESEEGSDSKLPSIKDFIDEVVNDRGLSGGDTGQVVYGCMEILRGTYYSSSDIERRYLRKLSRTYILLFMLKNEPRVVEYFRNMTSNFNLYIGSDLIVRALSEHMLPSGDQMTKNAMSLLKSAGSKLVLTEKALDEVWHHFRTTHLEFINNYHDVQNYMTLTLASQIDRILIRSYFYTKLERAAGGKTPYGWSNYLGQFLTVRDIKRESAREELLAYLLNEFGFEYESEEAMLQSIDLDELVELSSNIQVARGNLDRDSDSEEILSRNAAMTVLRIYQRRKLENERNGGNPYGFKTWWLTQQTRVHNATGLLVAKQGARYMMRPEFILHFLASIPSVKAIQESYESIFPSILGVKLGNRMEERAFKAIISNAREVHDEIDESRAKVVLANASSQLQSDFFKQYEDSPFFRKT